MSDEEMSHKEFSLRHKIELLTSNLKDLEETLDNIRQQRDIVQTDLYLLTKQLEDMLKESKDN